MNVRLVKRVDHSKTWLGKDKIQHPSVSYFVVVDVNGREMWLSFLPNKFSYNAFNCLCELEEIQEKAK